MRKLISLIIAVLALGSVHDAAAQWSTTGNSGTSPGTNYIGTRDSRDFVFKTQGTERGRIINTGGVWRFGTSTNFATVDATGKLTFGGTGVYQVGANKYVFQYSGTPNIGLYFNQTNLVHEFRDQNGAVVSSIGANSGNGYFKGNLGVGNASPAYKLDVTGTGRITGALKVGAYTLPATDGTAGQVLTSNGAGILAWSTVSGGGGSNPWTISGSTINYAAGNVGIGNASPAYKLDVTGTGRITGALKVGAYTLPATDGTAGQVLTSNGAGTASWSTVSGGGSNPWTVSGNNINYTAGNVGIGTATLATGYKLSVKGKIMCEEVKVQLSTAWPDYVFRKDYPLMPIEELASRIEEDKRLPGIPSANEIEKEGFEIGEMQAKMMEKIEELTLYLIDANKEIGAANDNIKALQKENEMLKRKMEKLAKGN